MTAKIADGKRLADRLMSLRGWRLLLVSFWLGALAGGATFSFFCLLCLFLYRAGMAAGRTQTRRAAFCVGWLFGAGYFAAGLYWVSNALLVDAARFAWLIPFTLLGLSLGLGLFHRLNGVRSRFFWWAGISRVLVFAATWTMFEGLRGVIFAGFHGTRRQCLGVVRTCSAGAAWTGVYGLSLVTVFAAAAPAVLSQNFRYKYLAALSGTAILAAVAVAGGVRLENSPLTDIGGQVIRIVQPNIPQRDKWKPSERKANFTRQLQLSLPTDGVQPAHVIWPETATSFSFLMDQAGQTLLRRIIPAGGLLITGALRVDRVDGRAVAAHNGLVAIDSRGRARTVYDKHHLVPFGEYVPFRSVLPVEKITAGAIDFSPGPGLRTLRLPGLRPFSPLICYEVIFTGAVA